MNRNRLQRGLAPLALTALATPAFAQGTTINAADTAWITTATALVLMMTIPGLALLYAGMAQPSATRHATVPHSARTGVIVLIIVFPP